ncbi:MAG: radical SAM protein, partial [Deltaproteobacteria bacterium]
GAAPAPMRHAAIGPGFDEAAIEEALERAGVAYARPADVAEDVARRLVAGQVVCWFQGRLEFGPRALGSRSIVADPRNPAIKDRVNGIKQREPWRPFGPSILAGHEAEWFEHGFDAPFMLFTLPVRAEKRAQVPAVLHVDGTTRPQSVHAADLPAYHRMISAFHRETGVPMVLNTSFNRRGEPIVCTPADALASFTGLGADVLAIGPFVVERGATAPPAEAWPVTRDAELAALPGGRRLALRVTTRCDLGCVHCTLGDHPLQDTDGAPEDLVRSLVAGRRAGCDELVLMRGEPLGRPDLLPLVGRARRMGYRFVQIQTHGRRLAQPTFAQAARRAGVDAVEVMLLGADPAVHDGLARVDGALRDTLAGLQLAARAGLDVLVSVPVVRANAGHLRRIALLVKKLGLQRLQLAFPRPFEWPDGVHTEHALRLSDAAARINVAARYAMKLGLTVTTEGVPLCLLDPALHGSPDAAEDFGRHRVDDLGLVHDRFDRVRERMRPDVPACRECAARATCPRTWALYLEVHGSDELRPLGA